MNSPEKKSTTHARLYDRYKKLVEKTLSGIIKDRLPRSIYEPSEYVLEAGGKRIRPVLMLLSCEAVGGDPRKALLAGAAIEILHNFTLVHDDIMDNASSRRGRKTVHTKWDTNVAILVGDELLALAYRALLQTKSPHIQEIAKIFTEGVVEVCEGQAYDKEFERRQSVTVDEYLLMIEKKTARMVAVSAEIGGLVGNGARASIRALRRYGEHVGRAFQIQDDLLDIIADEKELGKPVGGDLIEGKKTFLLLEALRTARGRDKELLNDIVKNKGGKADLIPEYRRIYHESGAIAVARTRIDQDITKAKRELHRLPSSRARLMLEWFAEMLLNRTY
ncbi:MAG: polyprenyl synthetase family protein [Ignavibacteriales bacterium]|nr:polyprenyl synthetase family protein [Ignavibacteriales bacterium]